MFESECGAQVSEPSGKLSVSHRIIENQKAGPSM
jgi:hypothetical protein